MKVTLTIWRQKNVANPGKIRELPHRGGQRRNVDAGICSTCSTKPSSKKAKNPVAFDHDCREGICGMCGIMINGVAHGPMPATTTCQLTMRHFKDGEELVLEPWRSAAFPFVKDLVVDRRAFDRIIQAGGYVSVATGGAPDGNAIPIGKEVADRAMDAAACIGCGACVAACPNGSAALFTGAKIAHLGILPQGKLEEDHRAVRMVAQMNVERLRQLHQHRRMHRRLPQGNFARSHREDEPRLFLRRLERTQRSRQRHRPSHELGAGEVARRRIDLYRGQTTVESSLAGFCIRARVDSCRNDAP